MTPPVCCHRGAPLSPLLCQLIRLRENVFPGTGSRRLRANYVKNNVKNMAAAFRGQAVAPGDINKKVRLEMAGRINKPLTLTASRRLVSTATCNRRLFAAEGVSEADASSINQPDSSIKKGSRSGLPAGNRTSLLHSSTSSSSSSSICSSSTLHVFRPVSCLHLHPRRSACGFQVVFCGSPQGHVTHPEGEQSDEWMVLAVDSSPPADLAAVKVGGGGVSRLAPEHAASCAANLSFNSGADGAATTAAQPSTSIVGQQRMMRLTQTAAPALPGNPRDICCLRASC